MEFSLFGGWISLKGGTPQANSNNLSGATHSPELMGSSTGTSGFSDLLGKELGGDTKFSQSGRELIPGQEPLKEKVLFRSTIHSAEKNLTQTEDESNVAQKHIYHSLNTERRKVAGLPAEEKDVQSIEEEKAKVLANESAEAQPPLSPKEGALEIVASGTGIQEATKVLSDEVPTQAAAKNVVVKTTGTIDSLEKLPEKKELPLAVSMATDEEVGLSLNGTKVEIVELDAPEVISEPSIKSQGDGKSEEITDEKLSQTERVFPEAVDVKNEGIDPKFISDSVEQPDTGLEIPADKYSQLSDDRVGEVENKLMDRGEAASDTTSGVDPHIVDSETARSGAGDLEVPAPLRDQAQVNRPIEDLVHAQEAPGEFIEESELDANIPLPDSPDLQSGELDAVSESTHGQNLDTIDPVTYEDPEQTNIDVAVPHPVANSDLPRESSEVSVGPAETGYEAIDLPLPSNVVIPQLLPRDQQNIEGAIKDELGMSGQETIGESINSEVEATFKENPPIANSEESAVASIPVRDRFVPVSDETVEDERTTTDEPILAETDSEDDLAFESEDRDLGNESGIADDSGNNTAEEENSPSEPSSPAIALNPDLPDVLVNEEISPIDEDPFVESNLPENKPKEPEFDALGPVVKNSEEQLADEAVLEAEISHEPGTVQEPERGFETNSNETKTAGRDSEGVEIDPETPSEDEVPAFSNQPNVEVPTVESSEIVGNGAVAASMSEFATNRETVVAPEVRNLDLRGQEFQANGQTEATTDSSKPTTPVIPESRIPGVASDNLSREERVQQRVVETVAPTNQVRENSSNSSAQTPKESFSLNEAQQPIQKSVQPQALVSDSREMPTEKITPERSQNVRIPSQLVEGLNTTRDSLGPSKEAAPATQAASSAPATVQPEQKSVSYPSVTSESEPLKRGAQNSVEPARVELPRVENTPSAIRTEPVKVSVPSSAPTATKPAMANSQQQVSDMMKVSDQEHQRTGRMEQREAEPAQRASFSEVSKQQAIVGEIPGIQQQARPPMPSQAQLGLATASEAKLANNGSGSSSDFSDQDKSKNEANPQSITGQLGQTGRSGVSRSGDVTPVYSRVLEAVSRFGETANTQRLHLDVQLESGEKLKILLKFSKGVLASTFTTDSEGLRLAIREGWESFQRQLLDRGVQSETPSFGSEFEDRDATESARDERSFEEQRESFLEEDSSSPANGTTSETKDSTQDSVVEVSEGKLNTYA